MTGAGEPSTCVTNISALELMEPSSRTLNKEKRAGFAWLLIMLRASCQLDGASEAPHLSPDPIKSRMRDGRRSHKKAPAMSTRTTENVTV